MTGSLAAPRRSFSGRPVPALAVRARRMRAQPRAQAPSRQPVAGQRPGATRRRSKNSRRALSAAAKADWSVP
jgi:hypothetical protein